MKEDGTEEWVFESRQVNIKIHLPSRIVEDMAVEKSLPVYLQNRQHGRLAW